VTAAAFELAVAAPDTVVDLTAAEEAAAAFLSALGQPVGSAGMADTPRRMARAYAELLTADEPDLTTFPNDEGYDELVVVAGIPVRSVCEHHMLPFVGVATVGYVPTDRVVGLSKLARVVEQFSHRVQTQERLTRQVAEHLHLRLRTEGVGVVVEAEHTCMSLRGVRTPGALTRTTTVLGSLRDDPALRAEFLDGVRGGREVR
jgi:GTP cyclohydrolase I